MTELIMKMVLCLLIALLLGLLLGWLLSKITQSKKHLFEKDVLNNTLDDRNSHIKTLEKQFSEKETALLQYSHENRELKENLAKNNSTLVTLENQLKNQENSIGENLNLREENQNLLQEINKLKDEAHAKNKELEELETVLVKAEKTIENKSNSLSESTKKLATFATGVVGGLVVGSEGETEEKLKNKIEELTLENDDKEKSIVLYQETISEIENELKLYVVNGEEDEFIISKDQFTHIEGQLVDYQKEIKALKKENVRLVQLIDNEKSNANSISDNMDDIAIVKLFRETYKKITKS